MPVTYTMSVAVPPNVKTEPPMRLITPRSRVTRPDALAPPSASSRVALSMVTAAVLPSMYESAAISSPEYTWKETRLAEPALTVKFEEAFCS